MSFPCAPLPPALPGVSQPTFPPVATPPVPPPVRVSSSVELLFPVQEVTPVQRVARAAAPRFASDFPLANLFTLAWLATLARATYLPDAVYFRRAVNVVNPDYVVNFVPNSPSSSVPGYATITLPRGAIVVVSGTTNAGQWLSQLLRSTPVEVTKLDGITTQGHDFSTMQIWKDAAIAISLAIRTLTTDPVLFVGHSMGGAIASILAGTWSLTGGHSPLTRLCTFASPKPGDVRLANMTRTDVQVYRRLWLLGDIVPSMPPDTSAINLPVPGPLAGYWNGWAQFRHAARGFIVPERELPYANDDEYLIVVLAQALQALTAGNPLVLADRHMMSSYTDRLLGDLVALPQVPPRNWVNMPDLVPVNAALAAAGV